MTVRNPFLPPPNPTQDELHIESPCYSANMHSVIDHNELIRDLTSQVVDLNEMRKHAIMETVDKDRLIVDLETQLTDLQGEFDASKEECVAHQKVILDLKLSLESAHAEIEYLHRLCGHMQADEDVMAGLMQGRQRSCQLSPTLPFPFAAPPSFRHHQPPPMHLVRKPTRMAPPPLASPAHHQYPGCHFKEERKYRLNSRGSSITSYNQKHPSTETGSNSSLAKKRTVCPKVIPEQKDIPPNAGPTRGTSC